MRRINYKDRKRISYLLKKGFNYSLIASDLGFNRSSIKREVDRNSKNGEYNARKAHIDAYKNSFKGVINSNLFNDIFFLRRMKNLYFQRTKASVILNNWNKICPEYEKPISQTFYHFYNKSFPKIVFMEELYREE